LNEGFVKKSTAPLAARAVPVVPDSLSGGKIVTVDLPPASRSYDIVVGDNILAEAGSLIRAKLGQRQCVIVTDQNVASLYAPRLEALLTAAGHTLLPSIIVPPGEGSKNSDTLHELLNQLFERKVDRQTLIIALGGGVVGDLAGFAASLYMRGIDLVQIPTTLLAQVDSSVGGKTGINSAYGKNTVGTFYQPRLVLADVTTLDSLPEREMKSGYAEVVKYGLIFDAGFFGWCQAHGSRLLRGDREAQIYAISKSCEHKSRVVMVDERETHERALLNLGHTFGHALESVTGFGPRLLHGEAVAIGMSMAFRLSSAIGLCPQNDADSINEHFKEVGLPVNPPPFTYDVDQLMTLMGQDKKSRHGKLTIVLARGIGQAFLSNDVNPSPVKALWKSVVA
jgi:3-dehydroquinate synthase